MSVIDKVLVVIPDKIPHLFHSVYLILTEFYPAIAIIIAMPWVGQK